VSGGGVPAPLPAAADAHQTSSSHPVGACLAHDAAVLLIRNINMAVPPHAL